jgi:hypothetical protein
MRFKVKKILALRPYGSPQGAGNILKATTDSKHSLPMVENILSPNFTTKEPDQAWVEDTIEIQKVLIVDN